MWCDDERVTGVVEEEPADPELACEGHHLPVRNPMRHTSAHVFGTIVDDQPVSFKPATTSSQVVHVPGKRHHLDADDLIRMYVDAKMSAAAIGRHLGVPQQTISRHIKKLGVTRSLSDANRLSANTAAAQTAYMANRRAERDAIASDVIARYISGQSARALAHALNVSHPTIVRILEDAGVERRGHSAAGIIRSAGETPEYRHARRMRASAKLCGRTKPNSAVVAASATKEDRLSQKIGRWEAEVAVALRDAGHDVRQQVAVGRYNLDLAVNRLAVEIHTAKHGPHLNRFGRHERVERLRDAGWTCLYVWCPRGVTDTDLEQIVAYVDVVNANPPTAGQYPVFRCRGKGRPARGANTYDGAFMAATSDVGDAIRADTSVPGDA